MKKTNKPSPRTAELLPAADTDGSPKPLVSLRIERPEPVLAGAQKLLANAQAFKVDSADAYAKAATIRQEIRAEHDAMESRRKKMKQPTLDAGREIDSYFQPAIKVLAEAIEEITDRMSSYDAQQRKIAEQKQREAEAEAARIRQEAERKAREERERTQMAMQEIQGINQQVIIAQSGRLGVRKGGTLECIRETLAETKAWKLEEEHFGALYGSAVKAKETAIAAIEALEKQFIANQEQQRLAKEQADARAAGDAERIKKAEADAAAQRQQAIEARKAQLRAEQARKVSEEQADAAAAASNARASDLEHTAATTVARDVKPDIVNVPGLQRPKVWKWRLLDKSKLKPEYLLVDEKTINKMVTAANQRAVAMVGEGSIEVYQEEILRQDR